MTAATTSQRLKLPEQAPNRRLSDSATTVRSVHSRPHSSDQEAELTKLRKWAAEAMTAGPPALCEPYADAYNEPMARRESDGGLSRKSAEASSSARLGSTGATAALHGSSTDTLASHLNARDSVNRRSFESSTMSHATFERSWRLLPSAALQTRPRTMFASPQENIAAASSHDEDDGDRCRDSPIDNDAVDGAMQQGLTAGGSGSSSLFKTSPIATRESSPVKEHQRLASSSVSVHSSSSHSPSSLAHSSPHTVMMDNNGSSFKTIRSKNTRGLQLGTSAMSFQGDMTPLEQTPKPRNMSSSSPTTSGSTCGDEDESEEERPIMTPLDESGPRLGIDSPTTRSRISRSNAIHHRGRLSQPLSSMDPTRRGAASYDSALHPLTSMGLSARRGSIPHSLSDDPRSDKYTSASPIMNVSTQSIQPSPPAPMSQATLLQLGQVNGITPPPLSQSTAAAKPIATSATAKSSSSTGGAFSSVVSQGLEMGLGFSMATSALYTNLEGPLAGLDAMAEARFSRGNGPGTMELGALARGLKITDREQLSNRTSEGSIPAEDQLGARVRSEQAADEVTFAALSREEADLSRRRTTGGLDVKDGSVGRRRVVQRSGTHDPRNTGAAMGNGRRLELGHPNFSDLEEEMPSPPIASTFDKNAAMACNSSSSSSGVCDVSMSEAVASGRDSTHLDTPSIDHKAMISPGASATSHLRNSYIARGDLDASPNASGVHAKHSADSGGLGTKLTGASKSRDDTPVANNALTAPSGGGHFGPGVRAKVLEVIDQLIDLVPITGEEGETINIVEYGCLNSRSTALLQPMVSAFARRAHLRDRRRPSEEGPIPKFAGRAFSERQSTKLNFSITHEDGPTADFRSLMQLLETHSDSYLDPNWQSVHEPTLTNSIFNSFVARPFGCRIAPPNTMHLGFSLMDLQWSHTPTNSSVSPATMAQAELSTFLMARANEFKKGSVFIMAYIARSEDDNVFGSSSAETYGRRRTQSVRAASKLTMASAAASFNGQNRGEGGGGGGHERHSSYSQEASYDAEHREMPRAVKKDIWTTLSNTLAPCIQRLVSCGMLKSDVARTLLHVPMHPRTPSQTRASLKSVNHLWSVDWSCGLGETSTEEEATSIPKSEPDTLRLPHPAWTAYQSGTLSRVAFSEHMIQLFKNLYESHFRHVLRERGRLTKGAVEFVLDSLWEVLYSRIVDQEPNTMQDVELEVSLCALRRL